MGRIDLSKIEDLAMTQGVLRAEHPAARRLVVACVLALVGTWDEEDGTLLVAYFQMISVTGNGCRYDEYPKLPRWQ